MSEVEHSENGVAFAVSCPDCSWDEHYLPHETWHQYCPECGEPTELDVEHE